MLSSYLVYPTLNRILCAVVTLIGAITDTKTGKIYNWLTFPAIIAGWILCLYFNSWTGLGYSFLATLAGIALYLPLALLGAYGMGDVKLMGAVGALCGSAFTLNVFLYTSVLGFFHAIIVSIINFGPSAFWQLIVSIKSGNFKYNSIQKENTDEKTKNNVKYNLGIDIFIGVIIASYYCFTF